MEGKTKLFLCSGWMWLHTETLLKDSSAWILVVCKSAHTRQWHASRGRPTLTFCPEKLGLSQLWLGELVRNNVLREYGTTVKRTKSWLHIVLLFVIVKKIKSQINWSLVLHVHVDGVAMELISSGTGIACVSYAGFTKLIILVLIGTGKRLKRSEGLFQVDRNTVSRS